MAEDILFNIRILKQIEGKQSDLAGYSAINQIGISNIVTVEQINSGSEFIVNQLGSNNSSLMKSDNSQAFSILKQTGSNNNTSQRINNSYVVATLVFQVGNYNDARFSINGDYNLLYISSKGDFNKVGNFIQDSKIEGDFNSLIIEQAGHKNSVSSYQIGSNQHLLGSQQGTENTLSVEQTSGGKVQGFNKLDISQFGSNNLANVKHEIQCSSIFVEQNGSLNSYESDINSREALGVILQQGTGNQFTQHLMGKEQQFIIFQQGINNQIISKMQ